jgi:CHAT domain-containing protein
MQALRQTEYDIVHYAGHGTYTETGLSAILLADGMLAAEDLRTCGFKANLVNLASCWGGMTTFSVWNELYGFARALLSTGTRHVVGSVYPLGDRATVSFSSVFYEHLGREGVHPCEAFRTGIRMVPPTEPETAWGGLFIVGQR